jgi:hypothetical protein
MKGCLILSWQGAVTLDERCWVWFRIRLISCLRTGSVAFGWVNIFGTEAVNHV